MCFFTSVKKLPGSGTGYLDLPCTAVPLWSQMTDVKSCRELEMLHGAEKCGCTHLHVKWPGRRGSSHIVRGTAPTCCLILHSPTVHQRIINISHGGKWICTERLPILSQLVLGLSPGLWPSHRATEITAQKHTAGPVASWQHLWKCSMDSSTPTSSFQVMYHSPFVQHGLQ